MRIFRFVVALLLLGALFYFKLLDLKTLQQGFANPAMIALSLVACAAAVPVGGVRWHILLRSQGLELPLAQTVRIFAIASFFTVFLPGGNGGDIVRGAYMFRAANGQRTEALLSIFVDRLIGLAAFLLMGVMAILLRLKSSYGSLELGILASTGLAFAAIVTLFALGQPIARVATLARNGRWKKFAAIVETMGRALRQYGRAWRHVLASLLVALLMGCLLVIAIVATAVAMDLGGLTRVEYGIAGIYGMIAGSLPITPGGLGVGEGAFASACVALQPAIQGVAYGAIFLLFRCIVVLSTLPGLALYLAAPQRATLLAPADTKA